MDVAQFLAGKCDKATQGAGISSGGGQLQGATQVKRVDGCSLMPEGKAPVIKERSERALAGRKGNVRDLEQPKSHKVIGCRPIVSGKGPVIKGRRERASAGH